MQGIGADRRKIIVLFVVISVVLLAILVAADQLSKIYFANLLKDGNDSVVIKDFFYFTYTLNTGSAYGLFSDKSWARTFFLIITPIALFFFIIIYIYSFKGGYKLMMVALILVIGGAIGNYIDRAAFGAVTDFICLEIGGNRIFGIFNLADVFLSAGVVCAIVHLLFVDKNALFRGKPKDDNEVSG